MAVVRMPILDIEKWLKTRQTRPIAICQLLISAVAFTAMLLRVRLFKSLKDKYLDIGVHQFQC
jgi:hypothetical protein